MQKSLGLGQVGSSLNIKGEVHYVFVRGFRWGAAAETEEDPRSPQFHNNDHLYNFAAVLFLEWVSDRIPARTFG